MENLHISDNKDKETVNRRQFLIRAGKAGISVADACSVRYYFYDPASSGILIRQAKVARLCFAAGAAKVIVTDNPINDPRRDTNDSRMKQTFLKIKKVSRKGRKDRKAAGN